MYEKVDKLIWKLYVSDIFKKNLIDKKYLVTIHKASI